jgi:hypothetical protein
MITGNEKSGMAVAARDIDMNMVTKRYIAEARRGVHLSWLYQAQKLRMQACLRSERKHESCIADAEPLGVWSILDERR